MSFFTLTALAMCAGTAAAAGYVLYRTGRLRRSTPYGETACRHYGGGAHLPCLFGRGNALRGSPAWDPGVVAHTCFPAAAGNPAPRPRHLCLPASLTRDRRVVIIGDVHGCADELTTLLDTVTRPTDLVLFVGDLVNKGAKSPQASRSGGVGRGLKGGPVDGTNGLERDMKGRGGEVRVG